MEDYLRPVIREEPHEIILHVGTNDINIKYINKVYKYIYKVSPSSFVKYEYMKFQNK